MALFAWIGLPGLSGFVAEVVSPLGLMQHEFNAALLSLTTSGLIAWMWVRADREQPIWSTAPWLPREWIVIGTLVTLNVALGVAPQFVISRLQPSLIVLLPRDLVCSRRAGDRLLAASEPFEATDLGSHHHGVDRESCLRDSPNQRSSIQCSWVCGPWAQCSSDLITTRRFYHRASNRPLRPICGSQ